MPGLHHDDDRGQSDRRTQDPPLLPMVGLAVLLFFPQSLHSEEGEAAQEVVVPSRYLLDLKLGNFSFRPTLDVRGQYDSNIALSDSDERGDYELIVSPTAAVTYETERFEAVTSYSWRIERFLTHEDSNGTGQRGRAGARYRGDGWHLGGLATYQRTVDPLDFQFTNRLTIWQHDYALDGGLKIGDLDASLKLNHHRFRHQVDEFAFFDNDRNEATLRLTYPLGEDWHALGTVRGGKTEFVHQAKDDNVFIETSIGASYEPSRVIGFVLEAGYRRHDYQNTTGNQTFDDDFEKPTARATVRWRPTDRDTFVLAGSRGHSESILSNFLTVDRVEFQYRHALSEDVSAGASISHDWATESTDDVVQDHKRIFGSAVDVSWAANRWLDVFVGWSFRDKSTNDGTGEYVDHQASVGGVIRF